MRSLFVSYRRGDSEGQARALNSELVKVIGKDSVFMDVDSIALGQDFRRILHDRLESCELMLVLIGPNWLDAKDTSGSRRLDSATDLVRQEIAAALKRNIPVTPVLLQGAQMPAPDQLPDDIKELVYRNGFELGHSTWESDVSEMVKRLGLDKQPPAAPHPLEGAVANSARLTLPEAFRTPWVLAVFVIVVALAAVLFYRNTLTSNGDIDASIQQPPGSSSQQATRPTAAGRAESSSQSSAQAPTGKLAALGTIKIANLKTRAVEVYEQTSDGSNYLSAGYAGTITPPETTLQVPAGTYKLKIGRLFVERLHVTSANSIDILFGTISVPGLARETEVYEQNSDGSNYLSDGYAGTITPPETTLQVPAGTYKLKFARMFVQPVRVEAGQTVMAK